jgi:hypothetical protein
MVQVTIKGMAMREGGFVIDMVVASNVQPSPEDVMDLMTRIFSKLRFNYFKCEDPQVAKLGYYFSDLARKKVFIGRIPENTYILLQNPEDAVGEAVRRGVDVVDLFVDVGSPFKHVYIVTVRPKDGKYDVFIIGLGYMHENVYIHMELIPRESDDEEIHVEVDQDMQRSERSLLERALAIANKQHQVGEG